MNFYNPIVAEATASKCTGRSLAAKLRHLSKVERAFLAADICCGELRLDRLTVTQAAALLGVNRTYIKAALSASSIERRQIAAGRRPLIMPNNDDATLISLARAVGADRWLSAGIAAGL